MPSPSDPLLQQTIDRFWETIPPVWRAVRSHVRSVARKNFEITVEQFHILRHIQRGKGCLRDLADAQGISRPAISQAVDILVHKGMITRTQSASDRRYVQLELTGNGASLLDAIFGQTRQWMAEQLASLSPEELQVVTRAMGVLRTTFAASID
ncbi:MAG: MarR family winged helix-turn-helix transcriptional regulator [Candidatus Aminicenantes bacterium]|nr:MarR family winged helix-turn-helix transcriptional regulator [Candidatus Aminicenantes bacterium]